MRIELDIPDWADERRILIVAGRELAAFKNPQDDFWRVKDNRCTHCGKCCKDCEHLLKVVDGYDCTLGYSVPLSCIKDPYMLDYCSITHKKVLA